MKSPKLFVALPAYGGLPLPFVQSLITLIMNPPVPLVVRFIPGDSLVSRARNTLTADFLASDCTHLLFIDTDLVFSADQIARLVAHDVPVVGGFYPKKQDGPLQWVCNALPDFPPPDERGLQPLRYLGTGFLLIKRVVFSRMVAAIGVLIGYTADGSGRLENDFWGVGVHVAQDGFRRFLSEDWMFCQRCLDLGIEVLGDPKVILKHIGQAVYPLRSQEDEIFNPLAGEAAPSIAA